MKHETHKNFKLTSLGKKKVYVYDLGVEDNENFFANNILVHNSNYLNLQDLVERKFGKDYKDKGISNIEITEWLVEFVEGNNNDGFVQKFLDASYLELKEYMNCPQQKMHMSLEKVASNTLFKNNKKRYAMSVIYSEGTWYREKPKIAITGLESVSSKTPMFARKFLHQVYEHILNSDDNSKLNSILAKQELEFNKMKLDEIAAVVTINTGIEKINSLNYSSNDNEFGMEMKFDKGLTYQLKAAYIHNAYNFKNNIHLKPIETNGTKIKILPLNTLNTITNINQNIGYTGDFPDEWVNDVSPQIDRNFIWNYRYIRTVDNFTTSLKYVYKQEDMDYNLF